MSACNILILSEYIKDWKKKCVCVCVCVYIHIYLVHIHMLSYSNNKF